MPGVRKLTAVVADRFRKLNSCGLRVTQIYIANLGVSRGTSE